MRFTYFLIRLQQPQNEHGWWTKRPRSVLGSRLIQNQIKSNFYLTKGPQGHFHCSTRITVQCEYHQFN